MSPIPWAAIMTHGPAILSAAKSLLANQSRKAHDHHQSIEARLERLEKTSVDTARLLQQMAEQLQALTLAQQALQHRLRLALIISGAAAVLGLGAAILAILN